MDKRLSHLFGLGKRGAERRFGELMNEMSVLLASFPHLSDAVDADELPVSFIMKRDSRGAQGKVVRRRRFAQAAVTSPVSRRIKNDGTRRRRSD